MTCQKKIKDISDFKIWKKGQMIEGTISSNTLWKKYIGYDFEYAGII